MSAAVSESSRLSDLAITLADHDPDIPWIIAADANKISAEPEIATAAAVHVKDAVPAHSSFQIGGVPNTVSVAENGLATVAFHDDQRLELMSLVSNERAEFENVEAGELSESGRRLALLRPNGDLDVLARNSDATWAAEDSWHGVEAFDWVPTGALCISQGGTISLVELGETGVATWEIPAAAMPVSGIACDETLLAVIGAGHIATFNPSSPEGSTALPLDTGAETIAIGSGACSSCSTRTVSPCRPVSQRTATRRSAVGHCPSCR